MTWSPSSMVETPEPTASTTPAPSWPSTTGSGFEVAPVITFQSLWQTPLAAIRTVTSPWPGSASSTFSTVSGPSISLRTAARTLAILFLWSRSGYARLPCACKPPSSGSRAARSKSVTSSWPPPKQGEVLVKVAACGVCASDLHVVDGELPEQLPLVLGHEASGVVLETGAGVERLRAGDHVVLALVPSCGACESCRKGRPTLCELGGRMAATGTLADGTSRLSADGAPLYHFNAVSAFAEYAVVPESVAVPIRQDVALDVAALIGCAVLTGWGAVTRIAGVEKGASVAVWGCGGVGLSTIQAARLAGAGAIVAVDTRPEKLELAERVGATATVEARPSADTGRRVRHATKGGADYAFEAIGRPETIREAWEAVRPGGTAVVVGIPPKGTTRHARHLGVHRREVAQGLLPGLGPHSRGRAGAGRSLRGRRPAPGRARQRPDRAGGLPAAFDRLRSGDAVRQLVVFS